MISLETLSEQAALLPEDQKFTLAHRLLAGIESAPDAKLEAAWDEEIRSRIARYDSGETEAIPADDVFADADRLLVQ